MGQRGKLCSSPGVQRRYAVGHGQSRLPLQKPGQKGLFPTPVKGPAYGADNFPAQPVPAALGVGHIAPAAGVGEHIPLLAADPGPAAGAYDEAAAVFLVDQLAGDHVAPVGLYAEVFTAQLRAHIPAKKVVEIIQSRHTGIDAAYGTGGLGGDAAYPLQKAAARLLHADIQRIAARQQQLVQHLSVLTEENEPGLCPAAVNCDHIMHIFLLYG